MLLGRPDFPRPLLAESINYSMETAAGFPRCFGAHFVAKCIQLYWFWHKWLPTFWE